jgi:hypothetical protein
MTRVTCRLFSAATDAAIAVPDREQGHETGGQEPDGFDPLFDYGPE